MELRVRLVIEFPILGKFFTLYFNMIQGQNVFYKKDFDCNYCKAISLKSKHKHCRYNCYVFDKI